MNSSNHDSIIIRTVTQKFREGESVLAILAAYQIVGNNFQNRLLVTVSSSETAALFSFSVSREPPESISDLTIVAVFPINESFFVNTESSFGAVSSHQFTVYSENQPTTFYYHATDETNVAKEHFLISVKNLKASYRAVPIHSPAAFEWLQYYKPADERTGLLAIDRSVADGSQAPKTRDAKFREELERRRHEYTVYEPYHVYTATWNVNGQTSETIELPEWLATSDSPPDIYAVGFQEIEWTPEKILMNETKIDRTWVDKVMSGLHKGAIYTELASVRLVGMMLTVAVKSTIYPKINDCLTSAVGTGTLKWGNKGGVGVSFKLNEALFCFVNTHLAAHTQEVERRNDDHDDIIRRMSFENGFQMRSIDEHHHIFWIGDLNYRLDGPEVSQEYVNRKDRDYNQLYQHDQLYVEKRRNRIFRDYKEGKIIFPPTYKYNPGTDEWDSSEKSRTPAWCDRILWKGQRIELLRYRSVMQLRKSDHKPVYADFKVDAQAKDQAMLKKISEEVLKTVDKYENDNQPQITVEQTDLDFGLIRFNEKYSRELLVANNCHLPVRFRFACKDDRNSQVCEEFIRISHSKGELLTGSSLSIRIDILVDAPAASRMLRKLKDAQAGIKVPLDILVLHVENGRDIFITIFGEYRPSCFGVSLDTLMKLNKPVSLYAIHELVALDHEEKLIDLVGDDVGGSNLRFPREIWRLVDNLRKMGLQTPQLFTLDRRIGQSDAANLLEIRDWLDAWSTDDFPGTPHSTAEALLMMLEALPEPVVTISERECIIAADNFDRCKELLRTKLKSVNRLLFLYICLFLQDLWNANKSIRIETIAGLFGRIMIRSQLPAKPEFSNSIYAYAEGERDQRRRFMMTLLNNNVREFARQEMSTY
ncbi:inositol polyphosphate 5-phosphatase OCRL-like [Anopheles stephensi]|uniref:inositol polyphosphate 5-phosphatase OCRL-like n=1 Tax=Anopheles stephensi TaxID=30069 RepID=UPI0016589AC7|nr:inositol polyphosphate 5-phosphatase OCRL-like [Anopheles stephensi]